MNAPDFPIPSCSSLDLHPPLSICFPNLVSRVLDHSFPDLFMYVYLRRPVLLVVPDDPWCRGTLVYETTFPRPDDRGLRTTGCRYTARDSRDKKVFRPSDIKTHFRLKFYDRVSKVWFVLGRHPT